MNIFKWFETQYQIEQKSATIDTYKKGQSSVSHTNRSIGVSTSPTRVNFISLEKKESPKNQPIKEVKIKKVIEVQRPKIV